MGCTQVPPCGEIVLVLVNLSKQNFKRVCSFFYDKIASPMSSIGVMNVMGGMKFMTEIKAVSNKGRRLIKGAKSILGCVDLGPFDFCFRHAPFIRPVP